MLHRLLILFFPAIIFILAGCGEKYSPDKARIIVFTRHEDRLPALVRLDGDSIGMVYEVASDTSLYPAYGSDGTVSFMLALGSYNLYARTPPDDPLTGLFYFWSFDVDIKEIGSYCYNLIKKGSKKEKILMGKADNFPADNYSMGN